jgi:hypothetical protein
MQRCSIIFGYFILINRLLTNDPDKPTAGDVFKGMQKFGPAFVSVLLFIIAASIASCVPVLGQIASYVGSPLLMFALMFIAFEDLGAIDAFKKVFTDLFSGKLLMPVLLGVLASLISGLGVLVCVVGVLFTSAYAMTLYVCAYRDMKMLNKDDILDAEVVSVDESTTGETQPDAVPPQAPSKKEESAEIVDDEEAPTVD